MFFTAFGYYEVTNTKTMNKSDGTGPLSLNLGLCTSIVWTHHNGGEGTDPYVTASLDLPESDEIFVLDSDDSERLWEGTVG